MGLIKTIREKREWSLNNFGNALSLSEYISKYATEEVLREQEGKDSSSEDDGETSDLSEDEAHDMEL